MIRPLTKRTVDGRSYTRRPNVETQIQALASVNAGELERRASILTKTDPDFVLSEALMYFVRNTAPGAHRDRLTLLLLQRVAQQAPRPSDSGGHTASLTRSNIRDDMVDHFIDLLVTDWASRDERLDFYEVGFYAAIAKDRTDASLRHWARENRSEELETDEPEVAEAVEIMISGYNPFDADEQDKEVYRRLLDEAIDSLPEFQRRIIEMLRQGIPIESKDPTVGSISKVLKKTEKTVRTHRDKAFASLRLRLERKGKL
ncbi:RNA polymerase sigma factor [Achromobacter xylosoxidans]|uniref:RNA polymerase sigma factor n=1 Tax=Alcaligenes xylosoxydans xylosoxydans TaxID=85698 RepID=UPI003EE31E05